MERISTMKKTIRRIIVSIVAVILLLPTNATVAQAESEPECSQIQSDYIKRNVFCVDAGILQMMLNRLLNINEIVDGAINTTTVRNIIRFQQMNDLEPSGQADKETISMLNQRYGEIARMPKVLVISTELVEVREGPSENCPSVGQLGNGTVCVQLESTREWTKVKFGTDEIGWIKTCNLTDTFVKVDIQMQSLLFVKNGKEIVYSPVITGCEYKGKSTPIGNYTVERLEENANIVGTTTVCFWIVISLSLMIGIHDADGWRAQYGGAIYKSDGSNGCINTPDSAAKKIYAQIELGMTIVIQ